MTAARRRSILFGALLPIAVVGLLWTSSGTSEAQGRSPSDLIKFLKNESDRPDKKLIESGIFSCGQDTADREAAKSLAKMRELAIRDIEKELSEIEKRRDRREVGSIWLQLVYAKIKGPAAYSRLKRMEGDPKLGSGRQNLDAAITLSLGLTSYVSNSRRLVRHFSCTRGPEPRDALDQLILALERNDRSLLEASLGPTALNAWASMPSELRKGVGGNFAVGYRFEMTGRWADPAEIVDDEKDSGDISLPENPHLETRFKNSFGIDCARHMVEFIQTQAGGSAPAIYLVDNADLRDLLGSIASCAATATRP